MCNQSLPWNHPTLNYVRAITPLALLLQGNKVKDRMRRQKFSYRHIFFPAQGWEESILPLLCGWPHSLTECCFASQSALLPNCSGIADYQQPTACLWNLITNFQQHARRTLGSTAKAYSYRQLVIKVAHPASSVLCREHSRRESWCRKTIRRSGNSTGAFPTKTTNKQVLALQLLFSHIDLSFKSELDRGAGSQLRFCQTVSVMLWNKFYPFFKFPITT